MGFKSEYAIAFNAPSRLFCLARDTRRFDFFELGIERKREGIFFR